MIVPFTNSVVATAVCFDPRCVGSLRGDPSDPVCITLLKVQNGEVVRVRREHRDVAGELAKAV